MKISGDQFASLSVKDLLKARDDNHSMLKRKPNVVGTAIGRYLIRTSDPWPNSNRESEVSTKAKKGERTFHNSEVRPYSWPCVLVLVEKWVDEQQFSVSGALHPSDLIPKTLYLDDDERAVPVCVVKVDRCACDDSALLSQIQWPDHIIGGGYPLVIDSQNERHIASVGCLVTDGHTKYALTNRHVAGNTGDEIKTILHGTPTAIGTTSSKQLTRIPFCEVYPEFASRKTFSNLDVGLIEIDDATFWSSEIVQPIGPMGDMVDLNASSQSLQLIDQLVEAVGSASGHLKGKILGLFYRYKTAAGYDFVTDFLIAPEEGVQTRPGDSGTVWVTPADPNDPTTKLPRPLAIQWGAQSFSDGENQSQMRFALATSLNNICLLLDVEVLQAHNVGASVTWGSTGHYTIAAYACDLLRNANLQTLMTANKENISFDNSNGALDPATIVEKLKAAKQNGDFCPLADVPDIVWKNNPNDVTGGRDTEHGGHGWTGPEHPNHFADADQPLPTGDPNAGETMLSLSASPAYLTVANWQQYYTTLGHTRDGDQGLLPFRVWQIYRKMVEFVQAGDVNSFVAAAGILSHYVGDACQPLHGSYHSDGYSEQATSAVTHKRDGSEGTKKVWPGQGVHSAYEDKMVDKYHEELYKKVLALGQPARVPTVQGGQNAGGMIVELMQETQQKLAPDTIIKTYIDAGGKPNNSTYNALFDVCGDVTAELWLMGASRLAALWESAWSEGGGDATIGQRELVKRRTGDLQALYEDPDFLPSRYLSQIQPEL